MGTSSLNTDGIAGNNLNMKVDTIPNYLGQWWWWLPKPGKKVLQQSSLNALREHRYRWYPRLPRLEQRRSFFLLHKSVIVINYVPLEGRQCLLEASKTY
jgi:hypothetical protein